MTLFTNAVQAIAKAVERLPLQATRASSFGSFGNFGAADGKALEQMTTSGWLFAVIDRIASKTSAVQWQLFQVNAAGDRTQLLRHDLLTLWNRPNPFYTGEEFREAGQQHFELAGELWWLVLRNGAGVPAELWPIRPDRIAPVPDAQEFIRGYIYRVGNEKIPLAVEDVVFIRRPSPLDPYRGIGVVGSILVDLGSEAAAAEWTRQFFRNSAEPGGVITFDRELSQDSFDRIVERWGQQHRGVSNAHRVAIIERGTWQDRKITQRDMEFSSLRKLGKDLILGAFGMPQSVLGITENVNRANAEAGEFSFNVNTVIPRLQRVKGAANQHLASAFGADLQLDYIDPTPLNRELNLNEAERGFNAGILTQNEARVILHQDEIPEGEGFKVPAPSPFALMSPAPAQRALPDGGGTPDNNHLDVVKADPLLDDDIEAEERKVTDAWRKRLKGEAQAIGEYIEQFFKALRSNTMTVGEIIADGGMVAPPSLKLGAGQMKIEPSDIEGYDWDWWARYNVEVAAELTELFNISILAVSPDMEPTLAMRLAVEYARNRTDNMLSIAGEDNLVGFTRTRVNKLIAEAIDEGQSLSQLQKNLINDFGFSPERAEGVARTETAVAQGQGAMEAAKIEGQDEKRWITQADAAVEDLCNLNTAQGWIPIGQNFASGVNTVPAHARCRCVVVYRTAELQEESAGFQFTVAPGASFEFRCPECHKLLQRVAYAGQPFYCPRCKVEHPAVRGD